MNNYNPNDTGSNPNHLFGLPHTANEAQTICIPVPWEPTASYKTGTALGPHRILQCSSQLDVHHPHFPDLWSSGIHLLEESADLRVLNHVCRKHALSHIHALENNQITSPTTIEYVNDGCQQMVEYVQETASMWLAHDKRVGVIGGDHSVSLGLIMALHRIQPSFSIVHIDAHLDLRVDYQSFTYSHASIMSNALARCPGLHLTSVGIRDYSPDEASVASTSSIIHPFFQTDIDQQLFSGSTWHSICDSISKTCKPHIYLSIDMDGLDLTISHSTGTPVPGGLTFGQVTELIRYLSQHHSIIGFDIVEAAPSAHWIVENAAARLLFHSAGYALHSLKD